MLLNEKSKFTDREIIEKGSRALIKELGYSGFLRFIRHSEGISKEDYFKLSIKLEKLTELKIKMAHLNKEIELLNL